MQPNSPDSCKLGGHIESRELAMAKGFIGIVREDKPKKKNKGVHAKSGTSSQKQSKNYRKKYRGQGRG